MTAKELTAADIPRLTLRDAEEAREYMPRYIWYETAYDTDDYFGGAGKRIGRVYHCPECGSYIEADGGRDDYQSTPNELHDGETMVCDCGYTAKLLCVGKMRSFETVNDREWFVFCKAQDGWLYLICAVGERFFSREDLDPIPEFDVKKVYAIKPGQRAAWCAEWSWGEDGRSVHGLRRMKSTGGTAFPGVSYRGARCYYLLTPEAIDETELRYCAWREAFRELHIDNISMTCSAKDYLILYSKLPMIEMLVKSGLAEPVKRRMNDDCGPWNWKAKTPWDFLRMSKADFKLWRKSGLPFGAIEAKRDNFPEMPWTDYIDLRNIWGAAMGQAVETYGASRYWKKLCRWWKPRNSWWEWQDTLAMETKVGNDISHENVLMPEDIHARHEELRQMIDRMENEALIEGYEKRRKELQRRFVYSDGDMMIVVPEDGADVAKEGEALKHCVKGYAKRHMQGVTCILFLRFCTSPGTRYVTIELDEKSLKIKQIHGYRNDYEYSKKPETIHKAFLDEWLDWVRAGSRRDRKGQPIRKETKTA